MSRLIRHPMTAFTSGEIDPSLFGRIDMSSWLAGLKKGRNVRVKLQGGITRRGGTRHVREEAAGVEVVKTASFAFDVTQTYTVQLTDSTWRVFNRNGALVAESASAPWTATQVPEINWAQSADTLLLFHPDMAPQRLRRGTTESSWTLSAVPLENLPAFDYGAVTPTGTITPSAVSGRGITLTASASIFTADMVGWHFFGDGGRARITAYTDATHVTADVLGSFRTGSGPATAHHETGSWPKRRNQAEPAFASTAAITLWSLEEPVISATRGWPSCGDFHLGRLWMGGFRSRPSSIMASKVGLYFDFDQGTALDDEAIHVTIDSRQVNKIYQIVSGRTLQIFTAGAEFAEVGGSIITPRTIDIKAQSTWGIDPGVRTTDVEGATLFAQKRGAAMRQFVYGDIEQAWASDLISLRSSHLIQQPVQVESIVGGTGTDGSNVVITNTDGTITFLTMARDQQIVAFTNWDTLGAFKASSCLQSGDVFLSVIRNNTLRLERYDEDALLDASVLVEEETAFDELVNLTHLATMEVGIILDGAWAGTGTVDANGYLLLPRACTRAEVGLRFTPKAWTMPIEPRDPTGALIGRKCRVVELSLRVNSTGQFTVNGQTVGRPVLNEMNLDTPPPSRSEDLTLRGITGWREQHVVEIEQAIPMPFELLALNYLIQIGGR